MQEYSERLQLHSGTAAGLKEQSNTISVFRLVSILVAIAFIIYAAQTENQWFWWVSGIAFVAFLLLMLLHTTIRKRLSLAETLVQINKDEIAFLESNALPFYDGAAFNETDHLYTYDLDIFGTRSLFHYLNRTQTVMGKNRLAAVLKQRANSAEIQLRQEAIAELIPELDWRQQFAAKAHLAKDSEKVTDQLHSWTTGTHDTFSSFLSFLIFFLPAVLMTLIIGFLLTFQLLFLHFAVTVFIFNLITLGSQLKKMNREISYADKINQTLLRYGELLKSLEENNWKSSLLQTRKQQLLGSEKTASGTIHELSGIFANLESLQNGFGAIILNGTVVYHLHFYRKLLAWKKKYAESLQEWLHIIGEIEMLNAFANFGFNNPDFCFPGLNNEQRITFEELGHPLITKTKRISNSVTFTEQAFIILTGSNMSGKSTFLRTLGINFVLANAGSVVCARSAQFNPMDIVVSMRLSDSLADSESYFFAEVKRLKAIMDQLDQQQCFVLLDEILRGTNSDDKRSGTVAVVKNLLARNVIGAIATHDLEVCQTTDHYPDQLVNKCFEVEIIDNELHFDYKLRDGICQNKSATFLMAKMGVI